MFIHSFIKCAKKVKHDKTMRATFISDITIKGHSRMKETTKNHYQNCIRKALLYIQKHISEDLQFEKLAQVACMSPYHFHRVFRGVVGETLAGYIRRLRIQHSAAQLLSSDLSVTDIAFEAGYDALESFTRAFQKQFAETPSNFRKNRSLQNRCIDTINPNDIDQVLINQSKEKLMRDVEVVTMNFGRVLSLRHTGPYVECCTTWERLCAWAGPKGLIGPQTKFLGLCYDDPEVTDEDKIRYDASMTIESDIEVEGDIFVQNVPSGKYAKTLHKGPYEKLAEAYADICGRWVPDNKYLLKHSPSIEIYLNCPDDTAPEELLTEIYVALD